MRILLVTSDFPHSGAKHGGGQLTFGWIRHLARSHELYLLSFILDEERSHIPDSRKYFREIRTVPARRGWWSRFRRLHILLRQPYAVVATHSPRFAEELKEMITRHRIDFVQIEHFHMGQYLKAIPEGVSRAIVFHDVVGPVLRQQVRIAKGLAKYYYYREWAKSRTLQKWYAIRARNVFVLSQKDRRIIESWDVGVKTRVLPPFIDPGLFRIGEHTGRAKDILFLGAMHRPVNQDAAVRLKKAIIPRVMEEYPEIRCLVVGARPPAWLQKMASRNFIVTGCVERIEPYLEDAGMLVVPLRVAGGIIVKILQAMAAGIPVVVTRTANAGIGAGGGKEILVADRPEDFADHILSLLGNSAFSRKIGEAGRCFIKRKFDPALVGRRIDRIYEEVAEG